MEDPTPWRNFPETEIIRYLNVIFVSLKYIYKFTRKGLCVACSGSKTKKVIQAFLWRGLCTLKGANCPVLFLHPTKILFKKAAKPSQNCSSARLYPSWVLLEGSEEVTSRHCLWSYLKQSWQLGTSAQQLKTLAAPQAARVASWAPSELVNSSHIAEGAHTLPLLCQLICSSQWDYFSE